MVGAAAATAQVQPAMPSPYASCAGGQAPLLDSAFGREWQQGSIGFGFHKTATPIWSCPNDLRSTRPACSPWWPASLQRPARSSPSDDRAARGAAGGTEAKTGRRGSRPAAPWSPGPPLSRSQMALRRTPRCRSVPDSLGVAGCSDASAPSSCPGCAVAPGERSTSLRLAQGMLPVRAGSVRPADLERRSAEPKVPARSGRSWSRPSRLRRRLSTVIGTCSRAASAPALV